MVPFLSCSLPGAKLGTRVIIGVSYSDTIKINTTTKSTAKLSEPNPMVTTGTTVNNNVETGVLQIINGWCPFNCERAPLESPLKAGRKTMLKTPLKATTTFTNNGMRATLFVVAFMLLLPVLVKDVRVGNVLPSPVSYEATMVSLPRSSPSTPATHGLHTVYVTDEVTKLNLASTAR